MDTFPAAPTPTVADPLAGVPEDYKRTREQAIAQALAAGLEVCEPADDELFIDIDNEPQWLAHCRSLDCLRERFDGVIVLSATPSKSGERGKKHVRIRMPFKVTPIERIAWQAALGSDPLRELLSCVDFRNGDERPTLFFEKPDWNNDELPF